MTVSYTHLLEIGLPEELLDFARMVNSGELSGRADVKVRLTADIDLTGHQWTPIGLGKAQFAGRFDGCGQMCIRDRISAWLPAVQHSL